MVETVIPHQLNICGSELGGVEIMGDFYIVEIFLPEHTKLDVMYNYV